MSFILVERIADYLARETGKPKEILTYSLIIIWNSIAGYGVLILVALFFGWVELALVAAITYSSFKIFMGGPHARSNFRCVILGTIIFNGLAYISLLIETKFITNLMLTCVTILILSVTFYAPADVPEKPITNKRQKVTLKVACFVLILLWGGMIFYFRESISSRLIIASCLGLLWQGFSITPLGYLIINKADVILGGGRK